MSQLFASSGQNIGAWWYYINNLIVVHNFAFSHGHHANYFVLALSSSTLWDISQYMGFQWETVTILVLTDSGDM